MSVEAFLKFYMTEDGTLLDDFHKKDAEQKNYRGTENKEWLKYDKVL